MSYKTDKIIGSIFLVLTILFVVLAMTNESFFNWAFERHHNQWSWYIRPLFIIPYCYFAYKRSLAGMGITLFCLLTSMFWFPKPAIVSEQVMEFLQYEKDYLYGTWDASKMILSSIVPISMALLGLAFWKRNLWMGLSVITFIAVGKMLWSVQSAGASGYSIIIPATVGLLICIALVAYGFKKLEKKAKNTVN